MRLMSYTYTTYELSVYDLWRIDLRRAPSGERKSAAVAAEARVDDVVVDRAERVGDAEVEEVAVAGRQLPLPHEDLFGRRLAFRQVDLIARARDLAEHVERKPLEQPHVGVTERADAVLVGLGEILRKIHRRERAAPGLAHAERGLQPVIDELLGGLAEDRLLVVVERVVAERVLNGEEPPGRFRVGEDVVFDTRRDPEAQVVIHERRGAQAFDDGGRPVRRQALDDERVLVDVAGHRAERGPVAEIEPALAVVVVGLEGQLPRVGRALR